MSRGFWCEESSRVRVAWDDGRGTGKGHYWFHLVFVASFAPWHGLCRTTVVSLNVGLMSGGGADTACLCLAVVVEATPQLLTLVRWTWAFAYERRIASVSSRGPGVGQANCGFRVGGGSPCHRLNID